MPLRIRYANKELNQKGYGLLDQFEQEVSGSAATLAIWNKSVLDLLSMREDPITPLDEVAATDPSFVMGSVFTGTYRILGAGIPTGSEIGRDLERARQRRHEASSQERAHIDALECMARGEFSRAATLWDQLVTQHPRDLMAARFAHDVYLHTGEIDHRLNSAEAALRPWSEGENGYGWLLGAYSFALEEAGRFPEAELAGHKALAANPHDCWALHSLAHVYEHLDAQTDALELLGSNQSWWVESNLLSEHIWWHLALRLLEDRNFGEALAIADDRLIESETAFRLADATSLLWRIELEGVDVGDRWERVVERWSDLNCFHTSAFIDVHAAMAFATAMSSSAASRFWAGVATPHFGHSENGEVLRGTTAQLIETIVAYRAGRVQDCEAGFGRVDSELQCIGGSRAQREIFTRTRVRNLTKYDHAAAQRYLDQLVQNEPNRVWVRRELQLLSTTGTQEKR